MARPLIQIARLVSRSVYIPPAWSAGEVSYAQFQSLAIYVHNDRGTKSGLACGRKSRKTWIKYDPDVIPLYLPDTNPADGSRPLMPMAIRTVDRMALVHLARFRTGPLVPSTPNLLNDLACIPSFRVDPVLLGWFMQATWCPSVGTCIELCGHTAQPSWRQHFA